MTDRDFADAMRVKALALLESAANRLRLHPENTNGCMAPHVAIDEVYNLRHVTEQLDALSNLAMTMKR